LFICIQITAFVKCTQVIVIEICRNYAYIFMYESSYNLPHRVLFVISLARL